jgi:hypothetical protein
MTSTQRIFGSEGTDLIETVHLYGDNQLLLVARSGDLGATGSAISVIKTTIELESFTSSRIQDNRRLIPYASALADDGSVVVMGASNDGTVSNGTFNQFFARVGSTGNLITSRYWGLNNTNDQIFGCIQSSTGDFVSCGFKTNGSTSAERRPTIRKTNAQGFVIWSKEFNQSDRSQLQNVVEVNDGYVFSGHTRQTGQFNTLLVKTDFDGNLIWSRNIDINGVNTSGETSNNNRREIIALADGSILMRLRHRDNSTGARRHTAIVKVDQSGSVVWSRRVDFGQRDVELNGLLVGHGTNEYLIVGHSNALSESNIDGVVLSFFDSPTGPQSNWLNLLVGPGRDELRAGVKFQSGQDKGYIFVGDTDSFTNGTDRDAWIVRTDANGGGWSNSQMDCWAENLPFSFSNLPLTVSSAGGSLSDWHQVVTNSASATPESLVPINNDNLCGNQEFIVNVETLSEEVPFTIYPNPTQGEVSLRLAGSFHTNQVELKVYNLSGQLVHNERLVGEDRINLQHLERAMYILVIEAENKVVGRERLIVH